MCVMQMEEMLVHVDSMVKLLIEGLQARSLLACVNLLLVADHGMAKAGPDRVIHLDKYIPDLLNATTRVWDGTFSRFEPKDESTGMSQDVLYSTVYYCIHLSIFEMSLSPHVRLKMEKNELTCTA